MTVFGIIMLIIWTISFAFSMAANDDKLFKTQYIITWIVLMVQLIDNYLIG